VSPAKQNDDRHNHRKGSRPTRRRDDDHRGRSRGHGKGRSEDRPSRRRGQSWTPDGGQLPKWVSEELARVTPKPKLAAAAEHLLAAATHFAAGKYGKALGEASQAKELSSRDATIREILGLSAYRLGQWDTALRELRTFRRLTGETTHLPVEMDVLRALERHDDVEAAWKLMQKFGGRRDTRNEARVVYGSYLLDQGRARPAWDVTDPERITAEPDESELRVWYVAARAAHQLGDEPTARRLFEAIEQADAAFPGLDELGRALRND